MSSGEPWVDIDNPLNKEILHYLNTERRRFERPCAPPQTVADPYLSLGSHPGVVTRLWDDLGKELPPDCRCLIFGNPSLLHRESGIVFATALGDSYALRVPKKQLKKILKHGAKQGSGHVGSARKLNLKKLFGRDWVFGTWLKREKAWLNDTYDCLGKRAASHGH